MHYSIRAAQALLKEFRVRSPDEINLALMAADRGVLIREKPIQGAEGRLVYRNGHGTIIVNSSIRSPEKKRFVIAHEIGHAEMHRTKDNVSICDESALREYGNRSSRESQANEFAGELLMPEFFFRSLSNGKPPTIELIKHLTGVFRTSLASTAIRYLRIGSVPSAVIHTKGEIVEWFWPSSNFPCTYMETPTKLPPRSVTARCTREGKEQMKDVVTAQVWFGSSVRADMYFHEDVLFSPTYNRALSILWEYKIDL